MTTVALTGATGFIGAALCDALVQAGYHVRALYRPRNGRVMHSTPGVKWVAGDLGDDDALAALVQDAEVVVHCAGSVRGATRDAFDRVNEQGTLRVAQAAVRGGAARRFLLISSLAAREPQLSDYSRSKHLGEQALAANAGAMQWAAIRPPAVYGPGDKEMLPLFEGMAKGLAPIPGDGKGRFSMIHVADLASAVCAWVGQPGASGAIYEIDDGHPRGYDWDTVLATASAVLRGGAPIRRLTIPVPVLRTIAAVNRTAARVFGYAPMLTPGKVREVTHADWVGHDNNIFMQATGWHPVVSFEQGLAALSGVSR
ncbi:NAD-dependent epimerase/dehydratase family protein [Luteibacter yeojuensis]|uniref:NAD-dependent epimerase/dehydratase domain-containing protein n=1 Tax=Luteibacter yeojuensis TaxID=345309 RepID=A0A0F3KJ84_9GAMM|nr:NAD-dependent epimerase/dehydratase family protein [Luteibacter yeojuensis]KJV31325.1 hypothetical protein VI08_13860 [Luteibacter yeojuensis]